MGGRTSEAGPGRRSKLPMVGAARTDGWNQEERADVHEDIHNRVAKTRGEVGRLDGAPTAEMLSPGSARLAHDGRSAPSARTGQHADDLRRHRQRHESQEHRTPAASSAMTTDSQGRRSATTHPAGGSIGVARRNPRIGVSSLSGIRSGPFVRGFALHLLLAARPTSAAPTLPAATTVGSDGDICR